MALEKLLEQLLYHVENLGGDYEDESEYQSKEKINKIVSTIKEMSCGNCGNFSVNDENDLECTENTFKIYSFEISNIKTYLMKCNKWRPKNEKN